MASKLINANPRKFQANIISKARRKLALYDARCIRDVKLDYTVKGTMWKIEVNSDYRLVSLDRESWQLMTHERYNGLMKMSVKG